mmetsp:Transcript_18950/g.59159  ORF Transcript_18950/g.59159 Transcript_18950/m.59159 type:complete len:390 (-) Transcript_18950:1855-3024(-)
MSLSLLVVASLALDQSRAHGFVPTCADEPRTCKPAPCRNGNLDYLGSLMHLPEQNAVVCTVPKAGCTTVREIAYDLEGETDSIKSREQDPRGFDIHSWWFGHKRNLKNMRPSAAMRLMKNASIRKLAMIRQPEDRFMSGVFDKGHKAIGREVYEKVGCIGANAFKNGTVASTCWLGSFASPTELQASILAKLPSKNDHFKSTRELCHMDAIPYDYVGDIQAVGGFIDTLVLPPAPATRQTVDLAAGATVAPPAVVLRIGTLVSEARAEIAALHDAPGADDARLDALGDIVDAIAARSAEAAAAEADDEGDVDVSALPAQEHLARARRLQAAALKARYIKSQVKHSTTHVRMPENAFQPQLCKRLVKVYDWDFNTYSCAKRANHTPVTCI